VKLDWWPYEEMAQSERHKHWDVALEALLDHKEFCNFDSRPIMQNVSKEVSICSPATTRRLILEEVGFLKFQVGR
jgi:hypothetical protein